MLDQDALQDLLSSLGPYRVEGIVRRGLVTTSIKAYDLHQHCHHLFKLSRGDSIISTAATDKLLFAEVEGGADVGRLRVTRRPWLARCLRERLHQFPYMTRAERRYVYAMVRKAAGNRVKTSNVMLTAWNRVVLVDQEEYYDDNQDRCTLLDDTEPAVSMTDLQSVLELTGDDGADDDKTMAFVDEYMSSLALFNPQQSCFERAAYLTIAQIMETAQDILISEEYADLRTLLAITLVSILKLSSNQNTTLQALQLIARLMFNMDKFTMKWYVFPAAMDIMDVNKSRHDLVMRLLSLQVIHHFHGQVEPVKLHRLLRLIEGDHDKKDLLMGQYSMMFGVNGPQCDIKYVLSTDKYDENAVVDMMSTLTSKGDLVHAVHLACQVYDHVEMDKLMVPLLNDDLRLWAMVLLLRRVSVHCLLKHIDIVPGLRWLCGRIDQYKDIVTAFDSFQPTAPDSIHPISSTAPDSINPTIPSTSPVDHTSAWESIDELLEVDDDGGDRVKHRTDYPFTRIRQSMRFWCPTGGVFKYDDHGEGQIVSVHANDQYIAVFTNADTLLYHHDGFPMKRPVKKIQHDHRVVTGLLCDDGVVLVVTEGAKLECRLVDTGTILFTCRIPFESVTIVKLFKHGHRVYLLTTQSLLVYKLGSTMLSLDSTTTIDGTVTCADHSPVTLSFIMVGTMEGRLHTIDTRPHRPVVVNTTTLSCSALACSIHMEWSRRCEHKRPRVWIHCGGDSIKCVDGVNGAVLRVIPGTGACANIIAPMGSHYLLYCHHDDHTGLVHHDYRMDKRASVALPLSSSSTSARICMTLVEGGVFVHDGQHGFVVY